MEKLKKLDAYFVLFISIVLFYCFFLSQFGFELWDTGYIPSFSWRIVNGENSYQDFIYKGPPITLYFHAFFMKTIPEIGQFYCIRILNYLFFATQVFFAVTAFDNFYNLKNFDINKWALMSVCFIISLLNFPPYPWPTTDGLLFASVAIYLLSLKSQRNYKLLLIAFFSILAALTKQSFYPIPLLFLGWIYCNYGLKKALFFTLFLSVYIVAFVSWISSFTTWAKFVQLTTGETTIGQLFYSGFVNYFWIYENRWFLILYFFVGLLFIVLFQNKVKSIKFTFFPKTIPLVFLLIAIGLCLTHNFLNASRVAFLSCCFGLLFAINFKMAALKYHSTLLIFVGIAWCSSISLGYPFPILFATGIIVTLIIIFKNEIKIAKKSKYYLPLLVIITIIGFSYIIYPYREKAIYNLNYSLNEISPKLVGIKSNESTYKKLQELKDLKNKFGNRFIVAPNIPMAHYLFNSESVLPADWIINTEINKNPKIFIEIAEDKRNYVFLEKSFLEGEELMPPKRENFSIIADYIYKNFKKIDETNNFIIYNGIEKNEPIPQIN